MSEAFRVTDKENVLRNGRKVTMFAISRAEPNPLGSKTYVHMGKFTADGYGASDDACIDAALEAVDADSSK